ncbi:helix-turn-helix domain-containing protein [Macrococcus armenti]|uniref:helix-turn-helix domain-containing protein n=1 Tax=Macrococcus armenti TaxID=2875764 RepID=UPI001CD2EF74|nr:helix-turn-helix domain-containing protein [Macrococcus armenti]UBH10118.1 helix-turn-helix domain-containing protein [Macrococcus armenti]
MRIRNYKQVDVLERSKKITAETGVKISKTDLSQYVNGKTEARQDKLHVLARTLEVSEAWLMGYDVPMNEDDQPTTIAAHKHNDLTEEEQAKVDAFIAGLIASRKN